MCYLSCVVLVVCNLSSKEIYPTNRSTLWVSLHRLCTALCQFSCSKGIILTSIFRKCLVSNPKFALATIDFGKYLQTIHEAIIL